MNVRDFDTSEIINELAETLNEFSDIKSAGKTLNKQDKLFKVRAESAYKTIGVALTLITSITPFFCPPLAYVSVALLGVLAVAHYYDVKHNYSLSHWVDKKCKKGMAMMSFVTEQSNNNNQCEPSNKKDILSKAINNEQMKKIITNFNEINKKNIKVSTHHASFFMKHPCKKIKSAPSLEIVKCKSFKL